MWGAFRGYCRASGAACMLLLLLLRLGVGTVFGGWVSGWGGWSGKWVEGGCRLSRWWSGGWMEGGWTGE